MTRVNTSIELTPEQAAQRHDDELPLLDIRSSQERNLGFACNAQPCAPDEVFSLASLAANEGLSRGLIICAGGIRSRTLVEQLHAQGFTGFQSVKGGFRAWQEAGLPVQYPEGFDVLSSDRYARHLVMPQVGPEGQRKLLSARVLLIGTGGLSSPAALYLAAAGVGTLGLVDDDLVERSNLQRQILHSDRDVGHSKIQSASQKIVALNPGIKTELFETRLDEANAEVIIGGWDVVIDGSDNFPTRYITNKTCIEKGIPLVYGAVMRFQGQVSVFWPGNPDSRGPCYRCLFPDAPLPQDAPNCSVAGVLGVIPGIIGSLQACEALKLILGLGRSLAGRLLMIDALSMEFRETRVRARPGCPDCTHLEE